MSVASRRRARGMWLLSGFGGGGVAPPAPLLLDTYTGAAAAYSLRKLSNSYSGSAIRVRRASDSAEQDIGFSGNDLDTASLTSFCTGTDGFVTTWYDQSGGVVNLSRATVAEQPKIYDSISGTLQQNLKPAVLFDGLDDDLSTLLAIAQPFTTIFVRTYVILQNSKVALGTTTSHSVGYADSILSNLHSCSYGATLSGSARNTNQGVACTLANGTNSKLRLNAGETSGNAGTTALSAIYIGSGAGSNNAQITCQEAIVYGSDNSASFAGIETNIAAYYGITLP